jgi:hypothetical protein
MGGPKNSKRRHKMRNLQVGLFIVGILAFLASALFIGQGTGDDLWRTGVAAMFTDLACAALWPTRNRT